VIYFTEAKLVRLLTDEMLDELCTQETVVKIEVEVLPNVREEDDVMYRLKVHGFVHHFDVWLNCVGSESDSYTWSDDGYMRDINRPIDRGSNYCTSIVGRPVNCIRLSFDGCISCDRIDCSNYCCMDCTNSPRFRLCENVQWMWMTGSVTEHNVLCSAGRALLDNWVQIAFACNNEIRPGLSDDSMNSLKLIIEL